MRQIISFSIFLFFLASCSKFYENIEPVDDLPVDAVFQNKEDLETALNGVYNILQGEGLGGLNLLLIPELLGNNGCFKVSGNPEEVDISNRMMRSSNIRAEQTWLAAYEAINLTNAILERLPIIEDATLTPKESDQIQGEALFIRGFLHFELVRYYGLPYGDTSAEGGIPIMTQAVFREGDLTFPSRSSVQAVYDQVLSDLTRARDLLAIAELGPDRANSKATEALLAKVAFQQENYKFAGALAQSLIDQVGFDATSPPQNIYNETANEILWVIAFSASDFGSGKSWFHQSTGLIEISDGLKTAFETVIPASQQEAASEEDLRIVDLRVDPDILTNMPLISQDTSFTNKYDDPGISDTPMARMAEFVLMQAEVLARDGQTEASVDLLNQVRRRALRVVDVDNNVMPEQIHLALYQASDFTNASDLIDAIFLERRVEFCFEGNYLHDVVRLKRNIKDVSWDDCRLRLPIPQRELDVNPNLVDNCY